MAQGNYIKNSLVEIKLDTSVLEEMGKGAVVNTVIAALYAEAEAIMTDSKENYCPVGQRWYGHRPGNLRNSGTVLPPQRNGSETTIILTYDTLQAPYATIVHERDPSIGQGKVKYLERPFLAAMAGIENRLGEALSIGLDRTADAGQGSDTIDAWDTQASRYAGDEQDVG